MSGKTLPPRRLKLNEKPKFERFDRASLAEGLKPKVEPKGGMFNAGILRDVVVLSRGEALGHDLWIDSVMLSDTMTWINSTQGGIKSRFTHPGMSSDGLGKMLGRIDNARMRGDSVIADLSFTESSHQTPDGDLAQYVTLLVTEDPTAAGLSIVFDRDRLAEQKFLLDNGATIEEDDDWGSYICMDEFKSPDEKNVEGYPHARLKELRAADVVDEPASNPDGMFSTTPVVRDADAFLSYALGLSTEKPADQLFGVDADRASQFVTRFLNSKGLTVMSTSTTTADPVGKADDATNPPATNPETKPEEQPPTQPEGKPADEQLASRAQFQAELGRFTSKFGAENGVKWFNAGHSYEHALELHVESLSAANVELSAKLKDSQERLSQVSIGVKEPLATAGLSAEGEKKTIGSMTNPTK